MNASVDTVAKLRVDEFIARYTSKMPLLQDNLDEKVPCVCVAKRNALPNVWIGWIAALLNLDAKNDDKPWMSRPGGSILTGRKHCARHSGQNEFTTVTPDSCPGYCMIAIAEDEASHFTCRGSQIFFATLERKSAHWYIRFR